MYMLEKEMCSYSEVQTRISSVESKLVKKLRKTNFYTQNQLVLNIEHNFSIKKDHS